ncbi:MAG: hypothetical protein JO212_16430 [Acetobacteraceae bacterium]|nr:hypothetical protein [Acetobacteraceae bacterium]
MRVWIWPTKHRAQYIDLTGVALALRTIAICRRSPDWLWPELRRVTDDRVPDNIAIPGPPPALAMRSYQQQ